MAASEDSVYANFAPCPLVPCDGIPSREFLLDVNTYINEQTVDVFSFRGCGTLGHLVLSAQPAVYALQSATVFAPPPNPGQRTAGHSTAATRADIMGGSQWNKGWDE